MNLNHHQEPGLPRDKSSQFSQRPHPGTHFCFGIWSSPRGGPYTIGADVTTRASSEGNSGLKLNPNSVHACHSMSASSSLFHCATTKPRLRNSQQPESEFKSPQLPGFPDAPLSCQMCLPNFPVPYQHKDGGSGGFLICGDPAVSP